MAEGGDKWSTTEKSPIKGVNLITGTLSTSTSSFEALDPHDLNLSRLATTMFQKTSDYLHGELTTTQDHYNLLEQINRVTITKYSDLKQISVTLGKTVNEYNEMYTTMIQPLLNQIDQIEENVTKFEAAAYRLDNYTKQLKQKFKDIEKK